MFEILGKNELNWNYATFQSPITDYEDLGQTKELLNISRSKEWN